MKDTNPTAKMAEQYFDKNEDRFHKVAFKSHPLNTKANVVDIDYAIEIGAELAADFALFYHEQRVKEVKKEESRLRNLLEDVINELQLSEIAIEKHGPLGTEPSKLVKMILAQKDAQIKMLKRGFSDLTKTEEG